MSADTFELVEENCPRARGPLTSDIVVDDEETESAMASAQEQREEEHQVSKSMILSTHACMYHLCHTRIW